MSWLWLELHRDRLGIVESKMMTVFCKKSLHFLYLQGIPYFQSTSSVIWDAEAHVSQCMLCYLHHVGPELCKHGGKAVMAKALKISWSHFSQSYESGNPTFCFHRHHLGYPEHPQQVGMRIRRDRTGAYLGT